MPDRVVDLAEVRRFPDYSPLADLAEIFNHEIIEDDRKIWRWKHNVLVCYLFSGDCPFVEGLPVHPGQRRRGYIDLNGLFVDLYAGKFSLEEYVKFYMGLGYSLSGFLELFDKEMDDNPDLTCVQYLIDTHRGKVLKI